MRYGLGFVFCAGVGVADALYPLRLAFGPAVYVLPDDGFPRRLGIKRYAVEKGTSPLGEVLFYHPGEADAQVGVFLFGEEALALLH